MGLNYLTHFLRSRSGAFQISTTDDHWFCQRKLVAKPAAAEELIRELVSHLERLRWPTKDVYGVHLAVDEALANAIRHGCGEDEGTISVEFDVSATELRIEVEDSGEGFDVEQVADPREPDRAELPSGRGVFLMRTYMDSVEYNEAGNRVKMLKAVTE